MKLIGSFYDWLKELKHWGEPWYMRLNNWCWHCGSKVPYKQPFCHICNEILEPKNIDELEFYYYGGENEKPNNDIC